MVSSPQVVFLDEPARGHRSGGAPRAVGSAQLSGQGVAFFVTTHYMDEAERCRGRVGYIYLELVAIGTVAQLQRLPDADPPGTCGFRSRP